MDFKKPLSQQQYAQERLYRHHRTNFVAGTIFIVIFLLFNLFSDKTEETTEPSLPPNVTTASLATAEGRSDDITICYPGAKIVAESKKGNGIISVFETEDLHSFAVYGPAENPTSGYEWTGYYYGALFPKEDLVKGTIVLPGVAEQYDIYLLGDAKYDFLEITRDTDTSNLCQQETIYFDDTGIATLQLDTAIYDPFPHIVAYDADGNPTILASGEE